ncbi:Oxysterol-binding protein-domain-containing protein [Pilobolus umbonatus]|nr:Oxysterol-binding protein-domain-containing protein [Pilobolus umbonatus]
MLDIRVLPRSVYEHHVYVQKENTALEWTFSTKKNSIGFGLYYKSGSPIQQDTVDDTLVEETEKKKPLSLSKLSQLRILGNETGVIRRQSMTHTKTSLCDSDEEEDNSTSIERRRTMSDTVLSTMVQPLESIQGVLADSSPSGSISSIRSKRKQHSQSAMRMIDNDFAELIPIEQVDSAKKSISGSYVAKETGNYVFIFDNKFSRNTSKLLSFTVTSNEPVDDILSSDKDMCGWLLKKKRKRLQGWARRWFELSSTGILTYSLSKDDIKRGSMQVSLSTLSISPKQRTFHLDSGTTIFHLKALSPEDYEDWLTSLRRVRSGLDNGKQLTNKIMWNNDITMEITPPESEESVNDDDAICIAQGLKDIDNELINLKNLINELKTTISPTDTSSSTIGDLASPLQSPTSLINRFTFKRNTSSTQNTVQSTQFNEETCPGIVEKLDVSVNMLCSYKEKVTNAYIHYKDTVNSQHQRRGLLSSKSMSAISYVAPSDQFFDAEEFDGEDFIISQDEESDPDYEVVENNRNEEMAGSDKEERLENEEMGMDMPNTIPDATSSIQIIQRRKKLPHPASLYTISVIKFLRTNIGKDLSRISLPVSLNEPISMLQRQCEELEYADLLVKAATECDTSMDRLIYVTAFAISAYSSSQFRGGRKPYNPLMNETYEYIRPDKGFRYISEKVSHHPLIMANHTESKHYVFKQTNYMKSKFWGKTLELIPEGSNCIELPEHNETYTFTKPSSWIRNLLAGTKYMEHIGEMKVINKMTGEYAMVVFKEATGGGFFGSSENNRDRVTAKFYTEDGVCLREVQGKWSESLSEVIGPNQYSIIWRSNPGLIPEYREYYGLTQFATELNEITEIEEGYLPITDTRLRPDQSLLEKGQLDEAQSEKVRVEQLQRKRKKELDSQNKEWESLWFTRKEDPNTTLGQFWEYKGGYWEAREKKEWPKEITPLW